MDKCIIVHGTKGSPDGNWFPWLAAQLRHRGVEVVVPRMPTPEGQSLANWMAAFSEHVGVVDDRTTIIGHSVGATFLLRYLEQRRSPIGRAVCVAGLIGEIGIPEYDALNSTFVERSYDWVTIKSNASRILCFIGENDPYVPVSQGLELATRLGVEPRIIARGGHLNNEFGYTSFPELLQALG